MFPSVEIGISPTLSFQSDAVSLIGEQILGDKEKRRGKEGERGVGKIGEKRREKGKSKEEKGKKGERRKLIKNYVHD